MARSQLFGKLTQPSESPGQVPAEDLNPAQRKAALARDEGVADAVGNPNAFLGCRLSSDRLAGDESRQSI